MPTPLEVGMQKDPVTRNKVIAEIRKLVDNPYTSISPAFRAKAKERLYGTENLLQRAVPGPSDYLPEGLYPATNMLERSNRELEQGVASQGLGYAAQRPLQTANWLVSPVTRLGGLVADAFNVPAVFGRTAYQAMTGENPQLSFGEKLQKNVYEPSTLLNAGQPVADRASVLYKQYRDQGLSDAEASSRVQADVTRAGLGGLAVESALAIADVPTMVGAAEKLTRFGGRVATDVGKHLDLGQYFRPKVRTRRPVRTAQPQPPTPLTPEQMAAQRAGGEEAMAQQAAAQREMELDIENLFGQFERDAGKEAAELSAERAAREQGIAAQELREQGRSPYDFGFYSPAPINPRPSLLAAQRNVEEAGEAPWPVPQEQLSFKQILREQQQVPKPRPQVPVSDPNSPEALEWLSQAMDPREVAALSSAQRAQLLRASPEEFDRLIEEHKAASELNRWMRRPDAERMIGEQRVFPFIDEVKEPGAGAVRLPVQEEPFTPFPEPYQQRKIAFPPKGQKAPAAPVVQAAAPVKQKRLPPEKPGPYQAGVPVMQSQRGMVVFQEVQGNGKSIYVVANKNGNVVARVDSPKRAEEVIYNQEGSNSKIIMGAPGRGAMARDPNVARATPSRAIEALEKGMPVVQEGKVISAPPPSRAAAVAKRAEEYLRYLKVPAKFKPGLLNAVNAGNIDAVRGLAVNAKLPAKEGGLLMKLAQEARGAGVEAKVGRLSLKEQRAYAEAAKKLSSTLTPEELRIVAKVAKKALPGGRQAAKAAPAGKSVDALKAELAAAEKRLAELQAQPAASAFGLDQPVAAPRDISPLEEGIKATAPKVSKRTAEEKKMLERLTAEQRADLAHERRLVQELTPREKAAMRAKQAEVEALLGKKATGAEKPGLARGAKNLTKAAKGTLIEGQKAAGGVRGYSDPLSLVVGEALKRVKVRVTPEGHQAWVDFVREDMPAIMDEAKATGLAVEDIVLRDYTNMTDIERKIATAIASRYAANVGAKFHTVNVSKIPGATEKQVAAEVARDNPDIELAPERMPREEQIAASVKTDVRKLASELATTEAAGAGYVPIQNFTKIVREMADGSREINANTLQMAAEQLRDYKGIGTTVARIMQARGYTMAGLEESHAILKELMAQGKIPRNDYKAVDELIGTLGQMTPTQKEKFLRILHEVGVSNILSGGMTAIRNVAGMTAGVAGAVAKTAAQGAFNKVIGRPLNYIAGREVIKGTDARMRDVAPLVEGMVEGIPRGLRQVKRSFEHETDAKILESFRTDMNKVRAQEGLSAVQKRAQINSLRADRDNFLEMLNASESRLAELGMMHRRATPGKFGKVLTTPIRGLKAVDEGATTALAEGFKKVLKARVARAEGLDLKSVKLQSEHIARAFEDADYYLFKAKLPKEMRAMMMAGSPDTIKGYIIGNTAMFLKTNYNLMKTAADHSLYGLFTNLADGKGLNALRESDTYGKVLAGTIGTYLGMRHLSQEGAEIHGSATTSREKKIRLDADLPLGPFIVTQDGKIWDFTNNAPLQYFVAGMAAWQRQGRQEQMEGRQRSLAEKASKVTLDLGLEAVNTSSMYGWKQAWETATKSGEWDPAEQAKGAQSPWSKYWWNFVGARLAPASGAAKDITRTFADKIVREPQSFAENVKTYYPGASQTVKPRYRWTGEPMQKTLPYTPFNVGGHELRSEPLFKELARLNIYIQDAPARVNTVPLSAAQRDELRQKLGPVAKDAMTRFINSPGYPKLPEALKAKGLEMISSKIVSANNKLAKALILASEQGDIELVEGILRERFKERSLMTPYAEGSFPYLK